MRSLDDLLEEAKTGVLTDEEISYVVKRIESQENEEDLYTLIHILGRADCIKTPGNIHVTPRGLKYRKLIEGFLYYPNDPSVASIALKTLCNYWGLTKDYLAIVKEFIKGVGWDEDDDIAITAINIAGEFLRDSEKKDKELLQLLMNILEKKDISEVNQECAYTALARAAGEEWSNILTNEAPNPHVLDKVYRMVHNAS